MDHLECTSCWSWSKLPAGFDERRHFGYCPDCHCPMYLMRNTDPNDSGMNKEVKATIGKQK